MEFKSLGDNILLAEHLKELGDDALLDFWRDSNALDFPPGLPMRRSSMKETEARDAAVPEELADFFEFILRNEMNEAQFFAIPWNVHANDSSRFFWNRGNGREDIVLQELQLRSAQSGLSGRTLLK